MSRCPCRPFPRKAREAFRFLADNFSGYHAVRRSCHENVSLVVGLGSYASVPTAREGRGTANACRPARAERRAGTRHALVGAGGGAHLFGIRRISGRHPPRPSRACHGQPPAARIRGSLWSPSDMYAMRAVVGRLLVLGGSGGTQTLNEQVPLALYKSGAAIGDWKIVHQYGRARRGARESLVLQARSSGIPWSFHSSTACPAVANQRPGDQPCRRHHACRIIGQSRAGDFVAVTHARPTTISERMPRSSRQPAA